MTLLKSITAFIQGTMRTTDFPATELDWLKLLATPVALNLPTDFGLALAPYEQRGKRTPLGRLIDAYRFDGELDAGTMLSGLLERWLMHHRSHEQFDLMSTMPTPYISGPALNIHSLLGAPGRYCGFRVHKSMWNRPTATSGHSTWAARSEWDDAQSLELESEVAGQRILLVLMCVTRHDDLVGGIHELYAQGAARVGVLAFCDRSEVSHGG